MGLSAVSWGAAANLLLLSAVILTLLKKFRMSILRSSPNAALVGSVCSAPGTHTAGTQVPSAT